MGRVEHVAVDIGDAVTEGQVLVAMDQRHLLAEQQMLQSELAAAIAKLVELKTGPRAQEIEAAAAKVVELEASVKLAKANLRRATELHRQSAVSTQERDENAFREESALAQLRSAREALELLREGTRAEQVLQQESRVSALQSQLDQTALAIDDASIEAPYSGHVQARHIDEGTIVAAGESILQIIESGEKEVHVGLPAELVRQTKPAQFVLRGPHGPIDAEVIRISPSIDQRTRTQEIVFRIVAPDNQVTVGASVDVDCPVPLKSGESSVQDGFWVPTDSLSSGARGLWALLVAAPLQKDTAPDRPEATGDATHTIERRQVELLSSQGKWSRVRGPIDRDELVVIEGTHVIVSGQQVRVQSPVSTAGPN
jgi:RND family efflux transporter MFP subunit